MIATAIFCIALAIGCTASPARDKRAFDPSSFFGGTGAFAGTGAFGGPAAFGGAFAGFPFVVPGTFAGAGLYNPFYHRPMFYIPVFEPPKPWYKGENVCTETKESELTSIPKEWMSDVSFGDWNQQSESCRGNNNKYVCMERKTTAEGTKMVATKYECCYGFERPKDLSPGCVEIDLRDVLATLRILGRAGLAELVEHSGWSDALHSFNYSLLCPPDDALEAIVKGNTDNDVQRKSDRAPLHLDGLLKRHLLPGFVRAEDIPYGHLLQTEDPDTRIRINVYHIPEKVMTANCVPVVLPDRFARNGVIHLVEKVIPNPSKTVADLIAGDSQFSILKRIVSRAGLVQTLRNLNGSFTLFAPTDSAFAASHFNNHSVRGRKCLESLMRHHLLDHVICSSALPPHARSPSGSGELLSLTRDEHGKLYVDDVQVVVRDWMALNGVVHVIDGVLTTRQAKCASQVMEDSSLTMFLSLVEAAGLKNMFDTMEDVTFFIPADQALLQGTPSRAVESLLRLNGSLGDALLYHVAKGRVQLNAPHQRIPSRTKNATLRIHVQSTFPHAAPQVLVQCATVLSPDNRLCGGTLYVIDRFLVPPKMTLIQLLERTEGFSTLVLLLRATGLDRRMLGSPDVPRTLLAPTDDAFHHELGEEGLLRVLENLDQVADLIRMHILPGAQCCSHLKGDFAAGRRRTRTIDGSLLALGRSPGGALLVGGARIVDCDVMATDGILQVVDTVVRHDVTVLGGGGATRL